LAIIALGTSNSTNGVNNRQRADSDPAAGLGQGLVHEPRPAVRREPYRIGTIVTWAANDIEDSSDPTVWYGPDLTISWVTGYGSSASGSLGPKRCSGNDPYRMANFGDNVLTGG